MNSTAEAPANVARCAGCGLTVILTRRRRRVLTGDPAAAPALTLDLLGWLRRPAGLLCPSCHAGPQGGPDLPPLRVG
jgi:hypothetical protein